MDRKAIIVLVLSFVLLMLWYPITQKLFPPTPLPQTNLVGTATNQVQATNLPSAQRPAPVISARPTTAVPLAPDAPEQTLALEDANARYTFTSYGGGLKTVELKKYPAAVDCLNKDNPANKQPARLNRGAPVPAFSILGGMNVQGDGVFALSQIAQGIRAEKTLTNGLRLVKEFQLSTNYMLHVNVRLENSSSQPLALPAQEWVIGTATPIGHKDESMMMGVQWYNGTKAEFIDDGWFMNRTLGCGPSNPRYEYAGGNTNVLWAAVHNQFFTMVAVPKEPAPRVVGRKIDLPPPTKEEMAADPQAFAKPFGYQTALIYPEHVLAPGQTLERRFDMFAGPKEYNTLARLGSNLDLVMNFGRFFGVFAKGLLLSMNGLNALGLSYGLAIIAITIIIKLLFWPLTNASTKSMKRMQALQPQMKALQEKYKDDPRKMNQKLMEFMKEHKVSPLGGCLPLLLQIPVFFGFYSMLRSAIELRGAEFLWACDLSQPDTIGFIPGLHFPINPLPLLMGVTMLWQARLTPASPGMDPVQQKMMKYMPLMFMVFLYNFSAGLTLYWTVQNLLTIAQMKLTRPGEDPALQGSKAASSPVKPGVKPKKK
jgi:YidC/Oxa1 family membrane protein insertase